MQADSTCCCQVLSYSLVVLFNIIQDRTLIQTNLSTTVEYIGPISGNFSDRPNVGITGSRDSMVSLSNTFSVCWLDLRQVLYLWCSLHHQVYILSLKDSRGQAAPPSSNFSKNSGAGFNFPFTSLKQWLWPGGFSKLTGQDLETESGVSPIQIMWPEGSPKRNQGICLSQCLSLHFYGKALLGEQCWTHLSYLTLGRSSEQKLPGDGLACGVCPQDQEVSCLSFSLQTQIHSKLPWKISTWERRSEGVRRTEGEE